MMMNESDETGVNPEVLKKLRDAEKLSPPYELMSRIMTDAENVRYARQGSTPHLFSRLGRATSLLSWPGVAGIAATVVVGVWIGLSFPVLVERVTPAYISKILHGHDDFDLFFHHDTFVASDDV